MAKKKKTDDRERMAGILGRLKEIYPEAHIQLNYENPYELLIATILSAQCTDKRVNIVTEKLFKKYGKPQDYLDAPIEELEQAIFSTGFYKAKAKNIKGMTEMVLGKYKGKVPETMEELLELPGVGRKTANVILGHCFGIPGIVVDTHVVRLSIRMGFVDTDNAEKIEKILMELVPKDEWVIFTHYFIYHGRGVCAARKPNCTDCVVKELCMYGKDIL